MNPTSGWRQSRTLNIWIKQNERIHPDLQLSDHIIRIADNVALKLLNWIVGPHLAEFVCFHRKVRGRVGTQALAACMAACRFALEIGASFVCEEGKFGIGKLSLRKKCNMSSAPKPWQALEALKSRSPRCYAARLTLTPPAIR